MLYGYFYWWYGTGFKLAWQVAAYVLEEVADFFSLEGLAKTWLAPWKNDVLTGKNLVLSEQVKLWEQNLASRFVGFFVRSLVILATIIILTLVTILEACVLFVWATLPAVTIGLVVLALWWGLK